jgi:A/G-specific adenine glycosylase
MPEAKPARAPRRGPPRIAAKLLRWFERHGRHDLPWQRPRTPYRVWVAEIMLQQTRVRTVVPYFLRFVDRFPSLPALARAPLDEVLALWSGLGYYQRARNLHRTARLCVQWHEGELPQDFGALTALPGIGRSTAGAILAQAHGLRFPILDGNAKRVLARYHAVPGWPGDPSVARELWELAAWHTPPRRVAEYTQAIMDLGATLCTAKQPRCSACPLVQDCTAYQTDRVTQLPTRRPSRALPQRETMLLVLRDRAGRILLERRPPTGIWAGLWSLPEATDPAEAQRTVTRVCGHPGYVLRPRPLPKFSHAFSHFRLAATPVLFEPATPHRIADAIAQRWLLPQDATRLALPSPIRNLLAHLVEAC